MVSFPAHWRNRSSSTKRETETGGNKEQQVMHERGEKGFKSEKKKPRKKEGKDQLIAQGCRWSVPSIKKGEGTA